MRRRRIDKRETAEDPKFKSKIVGKFINMLLLQGKKSLAEKIVYDAFDIVKQQLNEPDIIKVFNKAIDNVRPHLEVKPRRVGGATYQVPIEVRQQRGVSIALRWIKDFAVGRKGKSMKERLADEIIAAYKGEGSCVKKKEDTHKMAESNKAFAHFKW